MLQFDLKETRTKILKKSMYLAKRINYMHLPQKPFAPFDWEMVHARKTSRNVFMIDEQIQTIKILNPSANHSWTRRSSLDFCVTDLKFNKYIQIPRC